MGNLSFAGKMRHFLKGAVPGGERALRGDVLRVIKKQLFNERGFGGHYEQLLGRGRRSWESLDVLLES